jgi:hypothetical protein
VRTPEDRWLRELQRYDRHLFYIWDSKICRWTVMRRDPFNREGDEPSLYQVMIVQNEDGSYRPFDGRVMTKLRENDLQSVSPEEDAERMMSSAEKWKQRQREMSAGRDVRRLDQYLRTNYRKLKEAGVNL